MQSKLERATQESLENDVEHKEQNLFNDCLKRTASASAKVRNVNQQNEHHVPDVTKFCEGLTFCFWMTAALELIVFNLYTDIVQQGYLKHCSCTFMNNRSLGKIGYFK